MLQLLVRTSRQPRILAAWTLAFWSVVSASGQTQQPPPVSVTVLKPERTVIEHEVSVPGFLRAYEEAMLVPRINGVLSAVAVEEGDLVEKDAVLAQIDAPERVAAWERAVAMEAQARANVLKEQARQQAMRTRAEAARIEYEMIRALFDDKAATDMELQRAKAAFESAMAEAEAAGANVTAAEAAVATAQAALKQAAVMMSFQELKCPYERALVTRRMAHPGGLVQADETALLHLAVVDRLRLRVGIPEKQAAHLKAGTPVRLTVDALGGESLRTELIRHSGALDGNSQVVWAEAELENPDHRLLPGMYGRATIEFRSRENALTLPGGVVLTDADRRPFVWVVDNGQARKALLELGMDNGLKVEIVKGLDGSEQIIEGGRERVKAGDRVRIGSGS